MNPVIGLRQKLSFILKIDDENIQDSFVGNLECAAAGINLLSISELENANYWETLAEEGGTDFELLNCTSAGMWQLAKESKLYKRGVRYK